MVKDKLISGASVCVVVGGIAAFNDDVYQYAARILGDASLTELSKAGDDTLGITSVMASTAASYAGSDMLLTFSGLGALVLLGLMFRT
jgi:hypothetical protein